MNKKINLGLALLIGSFAFSQVGIGTSSPNASAILELSATDKGLLLPRVADAAARTTIGNIAGMQVYGLDTNTIWYNNGTVWVNTASSAGTTASNGLTAASGNIKLGGAITDPTDITGLTATNKIQIQGTGVDIFNIDGTTLSVDGTNNRVGIGTATPTNTLEVLGSSRFTGQVNFHSVTEPTNSAGYITTTEESGSALGLKISNGRGQGKIVFYTGAGTDNLERVRIDKFGNVGIGTTSPATKLHVDSGTAGESGITTRITNSAQLGTDANGKIIDVGADPNAGVSIVKYITVGALVDFGTTTLSTSVAASKILFRIAHSGGEFRVQARLASQPTADVNIMTNRWNYGNTAAGQGTESYTIKSTGGNSSDPNTLTPNWNYWRTISSVNDTTRSGILNIASISTDLDFDRRYLVLNYTRGSGQVDVAGGIKALIVNNYTAKAGD